MHQDITWKEIGSLPTSATPEGFWNGVAILINKPQVLNRRLCGAKILWQDTDCGSENVVSKITDHEFNHQLFTDVLYCQTGATSSLQMDLTMRELLPRQLDRFSPMKEIVILDKENMIASFLPMCNFDKDRLHSKMATAYSLCLHNKKLSISVLSSSEILTVDKPLRCNNDQRIELSENCKTADITNLSCTHQWLIDTLLPKLTSWSEVAEVNTEVTTLRLIAVDEYNELYQTLKSRYAPDLIKNWPEKTDPQKFVFEDIAIAAYLMVLWEKDRRLRNESTKQTFVDLGCGNGLLVHLLNSEGYKGIGIDIRRRKIWDMYGPNTNLKECTVTPSDAHLFPEYDWIIGNHSDELTPWIPMIAAKSSYNCRYFVLPCCMWDFHSKFQQKSTGSSQYRTYLDFVAEVGKTCGFHVQEDALRIPSTKRICFIGSERTYSEDMEQTQDVKRNAYIKQRCSMVNKPHPNNNDHGAYAINSTKDTMWVDEFKARAREEKTRNCSTVDRSVKDTIVSRVFSLLISSHVKSLQDERTWNEGGTRIDGRVTKEVVRLRLEDWNRHRRRDVVGTDASGAPTPQPLGRLNALAVRRSGRIPLSDLAQQFESDTLQHLKSECGGLQTLLRNHHHVFLVKEGTVQLRNWTCPEHRQHQRDKQKRKGKQPKNGDSPSDWSKTRLCYFHEHHPQGCPLVAEVCQFAHGHKELRTRPKR